MTDDVQSFYEIQLNTRHLVLAFLGAVAVGVTIFYLGVVVGRRPQVGQVPGEWQAAQPVGEAAQPAEQQPLEFYESVQEPVAQQGVVDPETAGGGAGSPSQDSSPAVTGAASAPQNAAAEGSSPPSQPLSTPVVPSSDLPESDPSLPMGWVVQVRSTTDRQAADALQAALSTAGFPAFVVSADVRGETYYRVRIGRYRSRVDAASVEARLAERADIESTWVTEG